MPPLSFSMKSVQIRNGFDFTVGAQMAGASVIKTTGLAMITLTSAFRPMGIVES